MAIRNRRRSFIPGEVLRVAAGVEIPISQIDGVCPVLHGGGDMKSFYQILALKIDVTRNSYLHIGYNLREFHEPNYLMLGIGYRFNNKRPKLF
jgi:hypothetical protein